MTNPPNQRPHHIPDRIADLARELGISEDAVVARAVCLMGSLKAEVVDPGHSLFVLRDGEYVRFVTPAFASKGEFDMTDTTPHFEDREATLVIDKETGGAYVNRNGRLTIQMCVWPEQPNYDELDKVTIRTWIVGEDGLTSVERELARVTEELERLRRDAG